IDTVIVCTLTGLVIVLSGAYLETAEMSGVALTSRAFETVIGWFPFVLAIVVMLFAFSTMIAAAYYGMKSWTYLFGKSKRTETVYKTLFLVFVVIGSAMQLGAVIGFSDAVLLAVAFPNILGMYFLMPKVKEELRRYMERLRAERS
ncbi:MAG: alanine:cation symporter family protein, partial [Wenzhouxiangellaceae bacterium]|nr:alanine:cation symporter family protein [Wenzhouxiangellaceae bacterium]